MDTNKDKARRLIKAAQQMQDQRTLVGQLGQNILFKARTAAAMHVTLLGGNPAGSTESRDGSS